MSVVSRVVASLGFVVPAVLAAWIVVGVDARAAPPDLRSLRFQRYAAYPTLFSQYRPCTEPDGWGCDTNYSYPEVTLEADRVVATDQFGPSMTAWQSAVAKLRADLTTLRARVAP